MNEDNIFTNKNFFIGETSNSDIPTKINKIENTNSQFLNKINNTINPFKAKEYTKNPYDINSLNDPCNILNNANNIDIINNNDLSSSRSSPSAENNSHKKNKKDERLSLVYLGDNNFEEYSYNNNNLIINNEKNNIKNEENIFISIEEFYKDSPNLKNEIFKDFKKPIYIPNEQIFQKAKKYVYENLVKKYKILKPKINDNKFAELAMLLAVQLVNKYNIECYYDFLVNKTKYDYKLIIDVLEVLKQYYKNKAKSLFVNDIQNKFRNEYLNTFFNELFCNEVEQDISSSTLFNSAKKIKRNYIDSLLSNKINYDYLCPNDRLIIQICQDCLKYRENEIKKYAKAVELTNNLFNYINNENKNLKEEINQKNKNLQNIYEKIIINKNKNKEYIEEISNYKNKISILSNNQNKNQNKFENLQKTNFITNYLIINDKNSLKTN